MIESQPIPMIEVKLQLGDHPIFSKLGERNLFLLAELCRVISFKKGQMIIEEGATTTFLYFITQGEVNITSYGAGIAIVGKGSLLGEVMASGLGLATAEVKARTDVKMISMPIKDVQFFAEDCPAFGVALHDAAMSRLLG